MTSLTSGLIVGGVTTLYATYKIADCQLQRLNDDFDKIDNSKKKTGIANAAYNGSTENVSEIKKKARIDKKAYDGSTENVSEIKKTYCVKISPLMVDGESTLVRLKSDENAKSFEEVGLDIEISERKDEPSSTTDDSAKSLMTIIFEDIETSVVEIVQFITDTTRKFCTENENKSPVDEAIKLNVINDFLKILPNYNQDPPKQVILKKQHGSLVKAMRLSITKNYKINYKKCLKELQKGQKFEEAFKKVAKKQFAKKKIKITLSDYLQEYGRKTAWEVLRVKYESNDSKPMTEEYSKNLFKACGFKVEIQSVKELKEAQKNFMHKKERLEMNDFRADLMEFFKRLYSSENASKFNAMFFILFCFKANGFACYVQLVNLLFQFTTPENASNYSYLLGCKLVNLLFAKCTPSKNPSIDPYVLGCKFALFSDYAVYIFSILTLEDIYELVHVSNLELKATQNSSF